MKFGAATAIGIAVAIAAGALGVYVSSLPPATKLGGLPFAHEIAPKALPALSFQNEAGEPRSLADFKGKLIVLNLWATWCPPCREEMPALDRLQAQLGGKDFEVLALSIDQNGTDKVRNFFNEIGIKSLPIHIDPSARAGFTLGVPGFPTTLLIDRSGREIGRHTGIAKWDSPEIVAELRRRMDGAGR